MKHKKQRDKIFSKLDSRLNVNMLVNEMNTYFWSDVHFFDKYAIKHHKRPYGTIEEMNQAIISIWNQYIKYGDVVYFLGDFGVGAPSNLESIVKVLNGKKHFIFGNKDWDILPEILSKNSSYSESFQMYKEIFVDQKRICMFHFPMKEWNKRHRKSWHLHGHTHGQLEPEGCSLDVGFDSRFISYEYKPIHLDEVIEFMRKKETDE